jgi:hypothetical protein
VSAADSYSNKQPTLLTPQTLKTSNCKYRSKEAGQQDLEGVESTADCLMQGSCCLLLLPVAAAGCCSLELFCVCSR